MEITILVTKLNNGVKYFKIINQKDCCEKFKEEFSSSIFLKYVPAYESKFNKDYFQISIMKNAFVYFEEEYDWDENLVPTDGELKYHLSGITYCPYCGEKIRINLVEQLLPEDLKVFVDYLNGYDKEQKNIEKEFKRKYKKVLTTNYALNLLKEKIGENVEDLLEGETY